MDGHRVVARGAGQANKEAGGVPKSHKNGSYAECNTLYPMEVGQGELSHPRKSGRKSDVS